MDVLDCQRVLPVDAAIVFLEYSGEFFVFFGKFEEVDVFVVVGSLGVLRIARHGVVSLSEKLFC